MLGFYLTRYGATEGTPLFASSHPDLVTAVLTALIEHLERLRREAASPEEARRFRRLLDTLRVEDADDE